MNKKKKNFNRFTSLIIIMILVFASIISRLTVLQIVKADEYKDKANSQSITEVQEYAPRGPILASDGKTQLATNVQSYNLTFTETTDSSTSFFDTMDMIFKILDENGETQKDDFALKINPYRFEFNVQDDEGRKTLEIRFKRDRGLNEKIQKKLFPDKKEKLTEEEEEQINEELLKITPEETFNYLVDQYKVSPEGIFEKILSGFKSSPEETIMRIQERYKIASDDELKQLLQQYTEASKQTIKDELFQKLLLKCNVEKTKLSQDKQIELERRYILVKDAIKMQSFSGYKPVVIASNIKKETAFIFSQKLNDLPGIDISMQPMRYYPFGQLASAVIGYISKIGNNHSKYEEKGYDVNTDYIGIQGIEGAFEDRLKGSKGGRIVKLNRYGRVIEELGRRVTYSGQTIQLTIDQNVQYAAETALDKVMADLQKQGRRKDVNTANATRGAAVAIDVNTGAILALASRPGFNPNDFSDPKGLSTETYNKYFNPDYVAYGKSRGLNTSLIDKLFPINSKSNKRYDAFDFVPKPLYNYATYSLVPPGSTFKPMTAIAGLESGVIKPSDTVNDRSVFDDGKNFRTTFYDNGSGNGLVNLTKALAVSSNPYFMKVGQLLRETYNDDILAQYAWKFGLGVKPQSGIKASTGIEIGENFGQVFNSWSNSNSYAINYYYVVRDVLKSGKGSYRVGNFTPINLDKSDGDTQKLRDLKDEFKQKIQEIIRTGGMINEELKKDVNKRDNYVVKTYTEYLTKLIEADSSYKGKSISNSEITAIANEMLMITIYDGYMQSVMPFNMYNASIGQGNMNFTPLQLANYIATLVNGGTRYKLHLVSKIIDSDGTVIKEVQPEVIENTGIKPSTVAAVKEGMHAVTGEDGTARGVFDGLPIDTAGKTGSATYSNKQDELGRTSYGVYVGFAPYDKPKIAVAVLVFDGGHGGYIAPVARAIYEAYFKEELDAKGYTPQFDVVAKPIQ
ncbi:penicillin-binding transpeptidase domain-containing protein [Clostridium sp. SYSU_GA19001]|uniref:penicillin-binding transpeptidase domain-containing protein n=1 Tax=Clostridium caldaquaticum TaxID=2940653 RepID=UPI002076E748|nr:penicillin-binding transpeptidase domain-containing protein [Clostridium caldaquaticum]MCM8710368.1 penicillin-binding transpeptidase domain-containing protein [Clostridium caldaquaticum]